MNSRIVAWGAIIAALALLAALVYRNQAEDAAPPPAAGIIEEAGPETRTSLRAVMTDCDRVGNRTRVAGYVHNTGTTQLTAVTVQSIWKNADGEIIDTGLIYAIGDSEPLAPGGQRSFEDTTDLRNVAKCNVRELDWFSSESGGDKP